MGCVNPAAGLSVKVLASPLGDLRTRFDSCHSMACVNTAAHLSVKVLASPLGDLLGHDLKVATQWRA